MTTSSQQSEIAAEQFARKLTAHLSMANAELPYVVTERLRAARMQALAARKPTLPLLARRPESATIALGSHDGSLTLGSGPGSDNTPLWVRRLLTALPLVALAAALVALGITQDSRSIVDVAEVDAALLTSELPPAAYTDPGFVQYLQTSVSDTH